MHTLTVREIVALYLRHSKATGLHGPAALAEREFTLRWFADDWGDWLTSDCKAFHLADWIESHPCWKSQATRRQKANCVRAAFNWALKTERIERNPFANVRYPEAERRAEMPEEMIDQLASLGSREFGFVVRWLRLTGCRVGEAVAANWADVDLGLGTWTIHRHKSRKYTGRAKVVVLVGEAVELLKVIARAMVGEALAAVGATEPDLAVVAHRANADERPIFLAPRGHRWNRHTLAQTFHRIVNRHGIAAGATLHGIRHRMAGAAIRAGASVKMIAEQLGHASTAITESYYFARSPEQFEAMREAVRLGLKR